MMGRGERLRGGLNWEIPADADRESSNDRG